MKKTSLVRSVSINKFFKINITLLFSIFCYFQVAYADATITSVKNDSIQLYSEASSSTKFGEKVDASEINGKKIIGEAMNGRFLKVEISNKNTRWIKAKHVITDTMVAYDVGACEKQNKATGTRAAVNCTAE